MQIVDVYEKGPNEIIEEIKELSREITNFDPMLINKVKWLALNKIDLISEDNLEELKSELENQYKDDLNLSLIHI